MFCRCLAAATVAIAIAYPAVAGPEESLFETANVIYQTAEDQPPDMQTRTYESVRSILNKIVEDYPASDLAVQIILKDEIEGLDVARLDEFLAEQDQKTETAPNFVPEAPKGEVAAVLPESVQTLEFSNPSIDAVEPEIQKPILPIGSEATEREISLDKKAIRDIQARLLVVGHDPNGVDGAIGRGTRAAIRSWQTSVSAEPTGYMNAVQLAALKEQSKSALDEWLKDEANARKYEPPAPIALGPRNMSGNWHYTTNCGSGSQLGKMKITGIFAMRHAGGRNYTGTLSNSQGLHGRVRATLRGRSVSAVTNFGLLIRKVRLNARVDDHKLVLRGRDSNGCSFYASKR